MTKNEFAKIIFLLEETFFISERNVYHNINVSIQIGHESEGIAIKSRIFLWKHLNYCHVHKLNSMEKITSF